VAEAEETEEVVEVEGPAECCRCTVRRVFELAEICSIESFKKFISSPYQYNCHTVLRVSVSPASKQSLIQ
jgi:hypothetical protein